MVCRNTATNEVLYRGDEIPAGCKGVNGNFNVNIDSAKKIIDNVTSDYEFGTWTRGKIVLTVSSVNPYFYDIDHYEYSFDGIHYSRDNVVGNQITISNSLDSKIYIRAIDTNGNISSDTIKQIRLDNDAPYAKIKIDGTMGANDWYTTNIKVYCDGTGDGAGSGVANCSVTPTEYNNNTTGKEIVLTIKDNVGNVNTIKKTIKIDKETPTPGTIVLNGTKGNGDWYVSDVKISNTACSSGVSGCSSQLSHTSITQDTNGTTVTLTVIAGNGKQASTSKVVKMEKTKPGTPQIKHNSGSASCVWQNNINISLSATTPVSGIAHYEVDHNGDGNSDTTTTANFIPWNGFSSCNTRFRAVTNAGNKSGWSNSIHIHQDTQAPTLNNWWWSGATYQGASLYIQASDNIEIPKTASSYNGHKVGVWCNMSRDGGSSWITSAASWDSNANAYRCDVNPLSWGDYLAFNQSYVVQLYIWDYANNGGYINQTSINIPPATITKYRTRSYNKTGEECDCHMEDYNCAFHNCDCSDGACQWSADNCGCYSCGCCDGGTCCDGAHYWCDSRKVCTSCWDIYEWSAWSSWTTNPCSPSDSCQVATCRYDSPNGQCYQ